MTKIKTPDALQLFEYPIAKARAQTLGRYGSRRMLILPGTYSFTIAKNPFDKKDEAWFVLSTPEGTCGEDARVLIQESLSIVFGESASGEEYLFRYHKDETEFVLLPKASGSRINYWARAKANIRRLPENEYVARFAYGPDDKRGLFPAVIALNYEKGWYAAPCLTLFENERNRIMTLHS